MLIQIIDLDFYLFITIKDGRHIEMVVWFLFTVHSQGWFGLWTFMDWFPMVGGTCGSSEPEPAIFRKFIVWNCDKGLEFVNAGALQFHDSILVSIITIN